MTTVQTIARNTRFLFLANIATFLLGFFSLSITGRYLGPELFGALSLALAFTSLFGVISDPGLSTLTVREVARDKSLVRKYIGNTAVMRAIFATLTFGIIVMFAVLLGYSQQTVLIISIVALSVVTASFVAMYNSAFQAFEKMQYQSIGLLLNSALFLFGVVIAATLRFDVLVFASLYVVVGAVVLFYSWTVFRRKLAATRLEIDRAFWRSTIQMALPFALTGIFVTVYYWIDSILLSAIKGVEVVGWYTAAYRLMIVLLVVPQVVNLAVLPVMSRFYVEAKASLLLTRDTFFRYMVLISAPMGIAVMFLADEIILFIFGKGYTNSIIALQILVWSSVFIFLASPFARFLESSNQQLAVTKVALICVVVNVALNLILIPPFGLVAASVVTAVTEGAAFVLLFYASGAITKKNLKRNLPAAGKTAVAILLMAGIILAFRSFNHVFVTLAATCLYVVALYVTRLIGKTDIERFTQILYSGGGLK
jgi:O-antigen/teichoic acid export membrane protein